MIASDLTIDGFSLPPWRFFGVVFPRDKDQFVFDIFLVAQSCFCNLLSLVLPFCSLFHDARGLRVSGMSGVVWAPGCSRV